MPIFKEFLSVYPLANRLANGPAEELCNHTTLAEGSFGGNGPWGGRLAISIWWPCGVLTVFPTVRRT